MIEIVVVATDNLSDQVEEIYEREFAGSGKVGRPSTERYIDGAKAMLATRGDIPTLVIVHPEARANRAAMGQLSLSAMTALLGDLRTHYPQARVILWVAEDLHADELMELGNVDVRVAWAPIDRMDMLRIFIAKQIAELVESAVATKPSTKNAMETIAEFRFHVRDPEVKLHYLFDGQLVDGPTIRIHGDEARIATFRADSLAIDRIAREPRTAENKGRLQNALNELKKLGAGIIGHGELVKEYEKITQLKTRIRFHITTSDDTYPCLFETMWMDKQARPFVVEYPTCRSLFAGKEWTRRTWSPAKPINILVVLASVPEGRFRVAGSNLGDEEVDIEFRALPFAAEEAAMLEGLREAYPALGSVTVLKREVDMASLAKRLEAALHSGRYDVFHFIGHAYGHKLANGAIDTRLVLPSLDPGVAEWVTLFQLETWLDVKDSALQFVYLSCCSALPGEGGAGTTFNAAEVARLLNTVPVTLGYRWDIEDDRAFSFATEFYKELLDKNACDFDEALQKARRALFDSQSGADLMWASPVLLQH
jgi:hypothetical protein